MRKFVAADNDDGANGLIKYSIVHQGSAFTMNEETGELFIDKVRGYS